MGLTLGSIVILHKKIHIYIYRYLHTLLGSTLEVLSW